MPSIENGYFSRLLTLIVQDQQAFNHRYVEPADGSAGVMQQAAARLYDICQALYRSHPTEFTLTPEQRTRLGHHLETAYPALLSLLGTNFHSVVLRMAVHIERIAMILTALRLTEEQLKIKNYELKMACSDTDYQIAELIGNKLLLHMAMAYRMIKGAEQVAVPKVQALDQRKMLLSLLPEEFETQTLLEEARLQGIPRRTIFRWTDEWQKIGVLEKVSHGLYKKLLASA